RRAQRAEGGAGGASHPGHLPARAAGPVEPARILVTVPQPRGAGRMNDFPPPDLPRSPLAVLPQPMEELTQGTSSLYRLFEAFIALREKNERQHKLFE